MRRWSTHVGVEVDHEVGEQLVAGRVINGQVELAVADQEADGIVAGRLLRDDRILQPPYVLLAEVARSFRHHRRFDEQAGRVNLVERDSH